MISNIIALDIGEKRIGVARANTLARLPEPLMTLSNDEHFDSNLAQVANEQKTKSIVVGLPRNLSGQETAQTEYVREFVKQRLADYNIIWQDETLSTVSARQNTPGSKGVDADAACVILEDYFKDNHDL